MRSMLTFMCRQAGHLPPLNADDTNMFSTSERIIQDHVRMYMTTASELKDLIQEVLHHPDFDVREGDTNMHEHLMRCLEAGDSVRVRESAVSSLLGNQQARS